jgi:hypothetical protein
MRTTQIRRCAAAPGFFITRKCKVAIPTREALLRYALQQASLESRVRAMRYHKALEIRCPQVSLGGVVLNRVDGNFLLKVCERRPYRSKEEVAHLDCTLESNGLRLLERDALDIKSEPLFSNARAVWSFNHYDVPLTDTLKIAAALDGHGLQSILELEERARPTCDILAALCALACEDLVELDNIREIRLGPDTMVRGRGRLKADR